LVTTITAGDARRFEHDAPAAHVLVVAPGYSGTRRADREIGPSTPRRATVVTSLDWHVKQANLEAFLTVADPMFERAGIELQVIGRAPADYARRLASSTNATVFVGTVDSLDETLAASRIGIVAEPLGGGFKLKTLDFVFHRVPIATLEGSVDGIALEPDESVLEFADAESLVRGVIEVIDDFPRLNALQERAYATCATDFDWPKRGEKLRDAISALPHTPAS
jgi:glycosyltransferase involved in cell wall biosynthesis